MKYGFFVIILVWVISSQSCLNQNGVAVDWMLLLHAPRTVSDGYLYLDSLT